MSEAQRETESKNESEKSRETEAEMRSAIEGEGSSCLILHCVPSQFKFHSEDVCHQLQNDIKKGLCVVEQQC